MARHAYYPGAPAKGPGKEADVYWGSFGQDRVGEGIRSGSVTYVDFCVDAPTGFSRMGFVSQTPQILPP